MAGGPLTPTPKLRRPTHFPHSSLPEEGAAFPLLTSPLCHHPGECRVCALLGRAGSQRLLASWLLVFSLATRFPTPTWAAEALAEARREGALGWDLKRGKRSLMV